MDKVWFVLTIASFVLSGAVVALAGIAKLTSTDKDDKLLELLRKLESFLTSFIVPKKLR